MPGVRLVPCHRFSEFTDWDELRDAGAFHALWLPWGENELRQCLGFVWEAEKRLVGDQTLAPMPPGRSLKVVPGNPTIVPRSYVDFPLFFGATISVADISLSRAVTFSPLDSSWQPKLLVTAGFSASGILNHNFPGGIW